VPSVYPPEGLFDDVASAEDLEHVFELESWTNDRISGELGALHNIPKDEWVTGKPMASVVMAAYCHPRPGGGRFNLPDRGAWYAGGDEATAHAEVVYHRSRELAEIGVSDARLQMRLYLADFSGTFHDVREDTTANRPLHDPVSYAASQTLAARLLKDGSNGVLYRSVRRAGGQCIACFRPRLVMNVRADRHFEYRWAGPGGPAVITL
jgi:hypothetical protein